MLRSLKTLHTAIWAIMTVSNFTAFYFAYIGRFDVWFWIPFVLIFSEIIVILLNKWHCPLTAIAAKYTEDRKPNFDIYLPEWLAKYNVRIFTAIIILEVLIIFIKNNL